MAAGTDNLELYLNDVFERECFHYMEKELQTGIETMVQKITDCLRQDEFLLNYIQTHLKGNLCPSGIIKVGSFYEGTKNNFPDEFDFIFLLCCVEGTSDIIKDLKLYAGKLSNYNQFTYTLFDKIEDIIEENKAIIQSSFSNICKNRKSKLHFNGYVEKKGASSTTVFQLQI